MEFLFEEHTYNKWLSKAGIKGGGIKLELVKVLIPFAICWLPLAIITLVQGSFWTGNINTSFISNFDTQARFLISMPILILSGKLISARLSLILGQFKNSGIINKDDFGIFDENIQKAGRFLKSKWTILLVLLVCYLQVFLVLFYENEQTSMLSWQIKTIDGENFLNFAGKWSTLISRPFILFLFLRWLLNIIVWGWVLRKISLLKLNLFAVHPDLCGGLGFIGYALRFFSPIAFAISAAITGYMVDYILIEDADLNSLKLPIIAYFIIVTFIFITPLLSFTQKLIDAREQSIFENYDFANGIFRELRKKFLKGYDGVTAEDLKSPDFSAAGDLSAVIENALKMKYIPFTLKDLLPLWVMTALPFLTVVVMEIPISEILKGIISFMV